MSRECCGPDAEPKLELLELSAIRRSPEPPEHEDDDCCAPKTAAPDQPLGYEEMTPWWRDTNLALPAISGVALGAGMLADRLDLATTALVLESGALAAGAWTFAPNALRRLARRKLGVGLLMTIAAVGAVALGRIGEAAALAFLFSIAEALEERAMDKAQHGLKALLALIPDQARVERDGAEQTVPAADLRIDDVLVVGAGERVSTDGVIVTGRSSVDTSAITGESIPLEVGVDDEVAAGSVNGSGTLRLRATADGRDNSLTQIVRLVEQAHARKGERARLADRIARPLVPGVLLLAGLVAAAGLLTDDDPSLWIERALVVLVAASPCAMAIAVPVTVISAIGSASRLGVVIKSGQAFEQLGTIRTVALDKTGTLTRNQPQVVAVTSSANLLDADVLRYAAALEATSTHPLADAVKSASPQPPTAVDVEEHAGRGIAGVVDGRRVRVGSPRWVPPSGLDDEAEGMAASGMSVIVVELDGTAAGVIGVRDELRFEAAEAVAMLHQRGIRLLMLTGDNRRTAAALAEQVDIDDVRAEQLPADKADAISEATATAPTAMIGDGINDAPALAAATVGIAMGVTGSAAAVESADVAFTGHDLRQIPLALDHARRGRRIMTGNIVLAVGIIVILVPLAILGVLGLAQVVLVHEAAEVVVILNGVRAARVGRPEFGDPVEGRNRDDRPASLAPR